MYVRVCAYECVAALCVYEHVYEYVPCVYVQYVYMTVSQACMHVYEGSACVCVHVCAWECVHERLSREG